MIFVGILLFAKKMKLGKLLIWTGICTIVSSMIIVLQAVPVILPMSELSDKSSSYTGSVGIFALITMYSYFQFFEDEVWIEKYSIFKTVFSQF